MKYRLQTGYPPQSALNFGKKASSSKSQMKRSKTSERKKTQMSFIFHLFFLCLVLSISSCSDSSEYDFHNSQDALSAYKQFHHQLVSLEDCNGEQLAEQVSHWQELSDTVFNYIKKDPSFTAHAGLSVNFQIVTDSVRMELIRLSDNCSLKDVALVKLSASPYKDLSDIEDIRKSAETFFSTLNENHLYKDVNVSVLRNNYIKFLNDAQEKPFSSLNDIKTFIKEEDRHFRTFLAHIDEYSSLGVIDITRNTDAVSKMVYTAASDKHFKTEEAMVFMAMRTNRRLLLNAELCADLIKKGKTNSAEKANAYLWMAIQPFLSMDSFHVAMLTDEQKKQMASLAESYPILLERLEAKRFIDKEHASRIPTQLMRLYLSTL